MYHWTWLDLLKHSPLMINVASLIYHLVIRVVLGVVVLVLSLYSIAHIYDHYRKSIMYWSARKRRSLLLLPQCLDGDDSGGMLSNDDSLVNCSEIRHLAASHPRLKALETTVEWIFGMFMPTTSWCASGTTCRFQVQKLLDTVVNWTGVIAFAVILLCILYVISGIYSTRYAIMKTHNTYRNIPYVRPYHMNQIRKQPLLLELEEGTAATAMSSDEWISIEEQIDDCSNNKSNKNNTPRLRCNS